MIAAEEIEAHTELLENVIATAQRLVKAERDKSKITPLYIADKVQMAADMFAGNSLVDIDLEKAVSTLIQRFSHWMGKATTLKDNTGHVDWLTAARKNRREKRPARPCARSPADSPAPGSHACDSQPGSADGRAATGRPARTGHPANCKTRRCRESSRSAGLNSAGWARSA